MKSLVRVGWVPILAHAGLLLTWDLAGAIGTTLLWLWLAFGGMILGRRQLSRIKGGGGTLILAVAVILRLLMLPLPSTLSDDIGRYLWDGKVVNSGFNPYLYEPNAPELGELRDEAWQRLSHRQVPTVYPPLSLAVFSIASRLAAPTAALKGLFTLIDVTVCVLLLLLAQAMRVPTDRVAWYAWNPLVTLEIAGMGHVDALGVACMVVLALCLIRRPRRIVGAALSAAGGVLIKLIPVVGLPIWARLSRRPMLFLSIAIGVSMIVLGPVAVSTGGVPEGLVAFGVSWEFNGPLYEPLWRLIERFEVPAAVAGLLDSLKIRTGDHDFWNRFYPLNYPQLWAKTILAIALSAVLIAGVVRRPPCAGMQWIFGSVILFSATVYPWYLLWVIPFAALTENRAWLVASATVMLSYIPQFTEVPLIPWIYLAVWAPPLLAWAQHRWSSD